ncbi:MAG TPA: type II CAAX endopeptidase family protein [Verrucomicrobiae bacterium]|nr:type II CAAX endopeptidase family protein [Verrucomicrobiae bacterium]
MRDGRPSWHWWWLALAVPVLVGPGAFWLVRAISGGVGGPAWMEEATFARVFQRLLMVGAVGVGIPWFFRWGVRDRAALGLGGEGAWRLFGLGLFFGVVIALVQLTLHLVTGARDWEPSIGWGDAAAVVMAGLGAAFFEEVLFRGALLGVLLRVMGWVPAVMLQAAVYATVHFLKPPGFGEGYGVHVGSGLTLLAAVPGHILGGSARWLVLLLLGCALGVVAAWRRNIWWCAGFHAAIAAGALALPKLTDYEGGAWRMVCAKDPSSGFDGAVLLGVVLCAMVLRPARRGPA